jgi:metal-responsive CopG/Arc/MetJ family transcriptional regulator
LETETGLELRQVRAATNQSLFREVNERVEELDHRHRSPSAFILFVCECANDACTEPISATEEEYEAVRAVPTHFVIRADHIVAEVERIVDENDRYAVVEKIGAGQQIAAAFDPRTP